MTTPDALRDADYIADVSNIPCDVHDDDGSSGHREASAHRRRKEIQAKAKIAFLDRLLRDFDVMIYCELSALYYMDCSIVHFAIRAIVQLLFFTPKAGPFPDASKQQPYVGAILLSNLFCMFLHSISANPASGEATRGYLHGGLFIDFIGQKGPVSKVRLLSFDLVIMVIQIVMLGVLVEKDNTRTSIPSQSSRSASSAQEPSTAQDLDAEERGVFRSDSPTQPRHSAESGIELQDLSPADSQLRPGEEDGERSGLLGEPVEEREARLARDGHPRDPFLSGQSIIVEMNIIRTIRDQWRQSPPTSLAQPSIYTSSRRDAGTAFLRRRFVFDMHLGVRPPGAG